MENVKQAITYMLYIKKYTLWSENVFSIKNNQIPNYIDILHGLFTPSGTRKKGPMRYDTKFEIDCWSWKIISNGSYYNVINFLQTILTIFGSFPYTNGWENIRESFACSIKSVVCILDFPW